MTGPSGEAAPWHEPDWANPGAATLHGSISDDPLPELTQPATPSESPALTDALARLPATFVRYETTRYITLSDAEPEWVRRQTTRLERAHHQFQRFCRQIGVEPGPLRHKLICILFARREAYRAFARDHDAVVDPSVAGYYAPASDRIVAYDPRESPGASGAFDQITQWETELNTTLHAILREERFGPTETSRRLRTAAHEIRMRLDLARARVDQSLDRAASATIIHEAVHQLCFHTGVQTPYVQYPLWISEGLATAFETDAPDVAFGPDQEWRDRRSTFETLLRTDQLLPLEALASLTMIPAHSADDSPTSSRAEASGDELVQILYHQSYALVTWLAKHRRTELVRYLELMRQEPHGRPARHRHLAIFTEAFGDPARLEAAWLRFERDRAGLLRANQGAPASPGREIASE